MNSIDSPEPDNWRIMIVDDNPNNLRVLYNILKNSDYIVHPASSGEIALKFLENDLPDLIMLDVKMPDIDGYDVCRQIKTDDRTKHIPVVFISGLDELKDKVKGFEVGGVDYITKPFHGEEVIAHIKSHLSISKLQKQLIVAKERAESADHMKSAFLAAMSHELRTPLNSIIGFVGIILQGIAGPVTDEQRKQLEMVKKSAKYLLTLINDIIDISKIEAGQLTVKCKAFDMPELIAEVAAEIEQAASKKGLGIVAEVAPEVDGINSDRKRVKQILINLIDNAIKFTETGSIVIQSKVEGAYVVTSVIDSGIGIKDEDKEKIFEAFLQLDTRLARTAEGTGLGLSICKRLVKLMGGDIKVDSKPGEGSIFTFRIPIRKE